MKIYLNIQPQKNKLEKDFIYGCVGNIMYVANNGFVWLFTEKYFKNNKVFKINEKGKNLLEKIIGKSDKKYYETIQFERQNIY